MILFSVRIEILLKVTNIVSVSYPTAAYRLRVLRFKVNNAD